MKKQALGILTTIIIQAAFMQVWFLCRELKDFFYFSPLNIQLILQEQIHADVGSSITFVRIFHNKVSVTLIEFVRHYLFFWDIRYLMSFISPLGVFFVFAGFWYILRGKIATQYKAMLLVLILSLPLVEMILKPQFSFPLRLIIIGLPYIFLSVVGVWQFLSVKKRSRYIWFGILVLLSIWWYFVFQQELLNFCVLQ